MAEIAEQVDIRTSAEGERSIPLVVFGLGPVGQAVVRAGMEDPRFELVACVEPRADRDELAGELGFEGAVVDSSAQLPDGPGVSVLCTSSKVTEVTETVREALGRGYDVVSTCEELVAPQLAAGDLIADLDAAAMDAGRTVIGAGVNPGFVMDLLPLVATVPCRRVEQVRVVRRVDVSRRRDRLQEKVGVGISVDEFAERHKVDAIGHVGLRASLVFLANALGWAGPSHERVEPVLDWEGSSSRGVRHVAEVLDESGEVRVVGLLEMYAGAPDGDRIEIVGTPAVTMELIGGVSGDEATVSAVVNVAARALSMPAGLKTLADVAPPGWSAVRL